MKNRVAYIKKRVGVTPKRVPLTNDIFTLTSFNTLPKLK